MTRKSALWIRIFIWSIGLIVIARQFYIGSKANCSALKDLLKCQYNGIIVNKYIDSSQHSYHTLEIKNFNDPNVLKLILEFDTTELFFQAEIKDTIKKNLGSDTVYVINISGKSQYIINFGCKDTL